MWEVIPVLVCLGLVNEPNPTCKEFLDKWGPYKTEVECLERAKTVTNMAPVYASGVGHMGGVTAFTFGCAKIEGEPV